MKAKKIIDYLDATGNYMVISSDGDGLLTVRVACTEEGFDDNVTTLSPGEDVILTLARVVANK